MAGSITTDHLGTPVLATSASGVAAWAGGLEPFGKVWTAGGNPDPEPLAASSKGESADKALGRLSAESIFLRYPGQWASDAFRVGGVQGEVYYNVFRWYGPGTGRYSGKDPQPPNAASHPYLYAVANPALYIDPDGLAPRLVPPPIWIPQELPCLLGAGFRTTFDWVVRGGGPRYAHCYASCAVKKCGGKNLAILLGLSKELFDFQVCKYLSRGTALEGLRGKHCDSAFQPSDLDDDVLGQQCPKNVPCEKQCLSLFGFADSPPGPFGGPQ